MPKAYILKGQMMYQIYNYGTVKCECIAIEDLLAGSVKCSKTTDHLKLTNKKHK